MRWTMLYSAFEMRNAAQLVSRMSSIRKYGSCRRHGDEPSFVTVGVTVGGESDLVENFVGGDSWATVGDFDPGYDST